MSQACSPAALLLPIHCRPVVSPLLRSPCCHHRSLVLLQVVPRRFVRVAVWLCRPHLAIPTSGIAMVHLFPVPLAIPTLLVPLAPLLLLPPMHLVVTPYLAPFLFPPLLPRLFIHPVPHRSAMEIRSRSPPTRWVPPVPSLISGKKMASICWAVPR